MPLSASRKVAILVSLIWAVLAYSLAYNWAEEFTGSGKSQRRFFDVPDFILYFLRNNLPLIVYWGWIWVTGKNIFGWVWDKAKVAFLKITGWQSQNKKRNERNENKKRDNFLLLCALAVFGVFTGLSSVMPIIWSGLEEEEVWDDAIICLITEIHRNENPSTIMERCDTQLTVVGWEEEVRKTLYKSEPRDLFKEFNINPYE